MSLMIYEYAVIQQPKFDKDDNKVEDGSVIVEVTTVLAESEDQAVMIAHRAIPETAMDDLGRLTVVVRPFAETA